MASDYGPHCPKCVSEGGRLVNTGFTKAQSKPSLDLKNDPTNDVMRRIRGMKFPQGGTWSANAEGALRQHIR